MLTTPLAQSRKFGLGIRSHVVGPVKSSHACRVKQFAFTCGIQIVLNRRILFIQLSNQIVNDGSRIMLGVTTEDGAGNDTVGWAFLRPN